jgi:hypothetical protein
MAPFHPLHVADAEGLFEAGEGVTNGAELTRQSA